ncbi:AMP-binding protein [Nocardia callitridis]|uniref:Acyl-CoA synthetase n=1 Tax=Nocardia callitridis TaxID=648753 RepID=A0ABP9KPW7_9NOCA
MRNFHAYAEVAPDRPAVVDPTGAVTSFGALAAQVDRLTRFLSDRVPTRGASVCVLLPNGGALLTVQRAVLRRPLYLTAINWHYAAAEIAYVLRDCDAELIFTDTDHLELVRAAVTLADLPDDRIVVVDETGGNETIAAYPATPPEPSTGGSRMLYTSGTTGKPKGVRRALPAASPERLAAAVVERAELYGAAHEHGRYLSVAPMYHAAPSAYADQALDVGHTVVILSRWDAESALKVIERWQITWTYLVPLMMRDLLEYKDSHPAGLRSLRSIVHTAAPCPPSVKRAMIEWAGPVLNEIYGGTEGSATFISTPEWLRRPGSVGRARKGVTITVRAEGGAVLPHGEIGLIYFANAGAPFEYHHAEDKTRSTRIGNQATLGDIGYLDAEGYLYLCDRTADTIISGGVNIYPAEIEHALLELPEIRSACVVGRPDSRWGESVHAVLVAADRVADTEALAIEIAARLRTKIAGYKVPRTFEFVTELPFSAVGKLLRREVRDRVIAEAGNEGGAGTESADEARE